MEQRSAEIKQGKYCYKMNKNIFTTMYNLTNVPLNLMHAALCSSQDEGTLTVSAELRASVAPQWLLFSVN